MNTIFNKNYAKFLSLTRSLISPESLVNVVLRVFLVKKELAKQNKRYVDRYELYQIMNEVCWEMGSFPGSIEDFYRIFMAAEEFVADKEDLINIVQNDAMNMVVEPALEQIFINNIECSDAKSVLIFNIEGFSANLLEVVKRHPEVRFSFMMNNLYKHDCFRLLKEIYKKFHNVDFIEQDLYSLNYYNTEKYDLIIAIPRFGSVSNNELKNIFIANSWDLVAAEQLLKSLNDKGILKVILTPKILFSGGRDSKFRKYLLENYKLLELADLPAGLFNKVTMVKTVLITLTTGSSDKIQVRKYVSDKPLARKTECTVLDIVEEETISVEDLKAEDSWNIFLLTESDDEVAKYKKSGLSMVNLKEIADVFRGKATSKLSTGKKVGVINIADIVDNEIDYEKVGFIDDEQQKIVKYLLEDGDILISSRGTTIKVAMFEAQERQYIPAVNLNAIRLHNDAKSQIKSEYLKIFFASSIGQKLLSSLQRGEVVMNINAKDLYSLNIPLLSLQEQQAIIDKYNEEFKRYRETLKQITDRWNSIKKEINHTFITKRE